jgi:hypothetical protein
MKRRMICWRGEIIGVVKNNLKRPKRVLKIRNLGTPIV